ncbi:MAG TPA: CopG family transcriptional regulator [Chthoniobacter sp.]
MKTITLKLHETQDAELERAAKSEQVSKSELIRRSVAEYLQKKPTSRSAKKKPSLHDKLKKYIPRTGTGIKDLSSNPKYLEGFGAD